MEHAPHAPWPGPTVSVCRFCDLVGGEVETGILRCLDIYIVYACRTNKHRYNILGFEAHKLVALNDASSSRILNQCVCQTDMRCISETSPHVRNSWRRFYWLL